MCDMIDSELGDAVSYVRPEGGLFIWCELPEDVDALEFVKNPPRTWSRSSPALHFDRCQRKEQRRQIQFLDPSGR